MNYFPILQELFESDTEIFLLEIVLLFLGTLAIGFIIGFAVRLVIYNYLKK